MLGEAVYQPSNSQGLLFSTKEIRRAKAKTEQSSRSKKGMDHTRIALIIYTIDKTIQSLLLKST